MLATHFARLHAQHFGDSQTSLEHRLAVGLDQHHAIGAHRGNRGRSADGSVHMKRSVVGGLDCFDGSLATDARLLFGRDDVGGLGIA